MNIDVLCTNYYAMVHAFKLFIFFMLLCVEGSQSEYVIFQAACTLKGAIVREWNMLSASQLEELRLYLLQYTANHATYVNCMYTSTAINVT